MVKQPGQAARDYQYRTDENARFSIFELLILTGAISAGFAAITQWGIVGSLILFWIAITASAVLNIKLKDPTQLRCWNQFLWGGLMPLACVFSDPFVFGRYENGIPQQLQTQALPSYVFIVWQILLLSFSWYVPVRFRQLNAFLGGSFLAGALFAILVGIIILPIALIGLMVLLGIMGFTPWFTARVFYLSGRMHLRRANDPAHALPHLLVVAGFVIPFSLWLVLWTLMATGVLEQIPLRPTETWNFD